MTRRRTVLIDLTPAEYGAVQAEAFDTGMSRRALVRTFLLPELIRLVAKHSSRLGLPFTSPDDEDGPDD